MQNRTLAIYEKRVVSVIRRRSLYFTDALQGHEAVLNFSTASAVNDNLTVPLQWSLSRRLYGSYRRVSYPQPQSTSSSSSLSEWTL